MSFREISGHLHLLTLVAGAASRGSLPPSLIFAGPDGVGKRLAAVALAQLVNCASPVAFPDGAAIDGPVSGARAILDACGVCASCTRISRGVHADVLMIEPGDTGAIRIDRVRDAVERAGYRPFEGRRRVVIIDDADALLSEAQNALLKTLEEPPSASMFVLVTSRPDVLLPTVRSRCQRLRFGRLPAAEVAEVLIRKHKYPAADAHAAASVSDGSIGAALAGGSEDFLEAREAATRLLQTVASSPDPRRRLDGSRAFGGGSADRDDLARRLHAVSSMLRDLGVLRSRADERALANADLKPVLQALLGAFDTERALGGFATVDSALDALNRNASPKIVADWVACRL